MTENAHMKKNNETIKQTSKLRNFLQKCSATQQKALVTTLVWLWLLAPNLSKAQNVITYNDGDVIAALEDIKNNHSIAAPGTKFIIQNISQPGSFGVWYNIDVNDFPNSKRKVTWNWVPGHLPEGPVNYEFYARSDMEVIYQFAYGNGEWADYNEANPLTAELEILAAWWADTCDDMPCDPILWATFWENENEFELVEYDQKVTSAPLPIELKNFVAACERDGQQVRLQRETESEKNNDGFRVQKSADGEKRSNIAFVKGAWTSDEPTEYTYIDDSSDGNDNEVKYYRLNSISSSDGSGEYSPIQAVEDCDSGEGYAVSLSPNPVTDILNLKISPSNNELTQTVQIFNMQWGIIHNEVVNDSNTVNFDFSQLPAGGYVVRVREGNGVNIITQTVVKQ
jgi:hypothetical protein